MIKQLSMIGAAIAMTAGAVIPASAEARPQYRGYDRGYDRGYYNGNYYNGGNHYRGYRYQDRRPYRGYRNNYRCDSGTGGTIIGAIAGGLLGNEVVGRHGDKTAGAIIGAGVGALAGRAIDRADSPRRC